MSPKSASIASFIKNNKSYFLATIFLMLLSAIAAYSLKRPQVTTSYPQTQKLENTNNLICEPLMKSGIGARDTCEEKNMYGFAEESKESVLEEGGIVNGKDVDKKAFGKYRIKYRVANGIISIREERLIKELEQEQPAKRFKIVSENEKYLIATLLDHPYLSTAAGTLLLDKSKGLLIETDTSSSLFCYANLLSYSYLYSCRENND